MTRLIMLGDAGHTGFGTVTYDLGRELLTAGVDVRFISQNVNSEPLPEPFASRTWNAQHGTFDFIGTLTRGFRDGWKADAILLLGDFFATRNLMLAHPDILAALKATPTLHYCPVEGIGLPLSWKALWDIATPVAMTEFGADQIALVTGTRPPVVYHGVNTEDFYPVAFGHPGVRVVEGKDVKVPTKEAAKASFGYPADRILTLRTDRHMPRKQYNRLLRAMVPVMAEVPELDFAVHCRWDDEGGVLGDTKSKIPAEFHSRFIATRRGHNTFTGYSRSDLNILYNAADIYLSVSAEGFGLTVAEALACGVPVVAMDYSAVSEVVGGPVSSPRIGPNGMNLDEEPYKQGKGGLLVRWHHLTDNEYDHHWAAVDEVAFAEAVIALARKPARRRALGKAGAEHVRRTFSWAESARDMGAIIERAIGQEVAA